jgi:hypothetical protein
MVGPSPRRVSPVRLAGLTLAACAWLPGCEDSGSCAALSEPDLLVTAYIDHNGERARTEIEVMRVGDDAGLSLALCKGASIAVDGAAATRVRKPSGSYVYKVDAADDATDAADVEHELRLRDDDVDVTYLVKAEAPAFAITAPKAGEKLARGVAWDVAWEPARPGSTIIARIDDAIDGKACLAEPIVLELPDEGTAQVAPDQLKAGLSRPENCDATLRLSRVAITPLEAKSGASRIHADSRARIATWRELEFISSDS